jgi:DNA-directed RNA polymerase subunit beta'
MAFYEMPLNARNLGRIVADCRHVLGQEATVALLERIKQIGFQEATRCGVSFAMDDLCSPADKEALLARAQDKADQIIRLHEDGMISDEERSEKLIRLWERATKDVAEQLMAELAADRRAEQAINPLYAMAASGARGSKEQIGQLAGMRGAMRRPSGEVLETPIKASFREGLSSLEYWSSTHGARKGLIDTAMKTADSGYLTRKLADVAQHVVVTQHDCGTHGQVVERRVVEAANKTLPPDKRVARTQPLLLGVTRAAVQAESFLSAASFQETTKVLTQAALAGQVDELRGLKENVLLGHLIPVGTGFRGAVEPQGQA